MATTAYTAPTLIDHGTLVKATQGTCTCHSEDCGFKSATEE